ncbi:MAG: hypothetical protein JST43_14220 [Bacteroidetes bacterium]|nr:hypothetical protein [Bacteroidota bacterium]MBS1541474.1 hypothetical protein [Bacteroidota bacterium]
MFRVIPTFRFQKESKKIARKFPAFKFSLDQLITSLSHQPIQGSHLGEGIYKVRMAIAGKASGKSYAPAPSMR